MGVAVWKRGDDDRSPEPAGLDYLPPALPGCFYRIEVVGEARSPWRSTPSEAMADAVALDLASWDGSRREHFLAVPVHMRIIGPERAR